MSPEIRYFWQLTGFCRNPAIPRGVRQASTDLELRSVVCTTVRHRIDSVSEPTVSPTGSDYCSGASGGQAVIGGLVGITPSCIDSCLLLGCLSVHTMALEISDGVSQRGLIPSCRIHPAVRAADMLSGSVYGPFAVPFNYTTYRPDRSRRDFGRIFRSGSRPKDDEYRHECYRYF